MALTATQVQQFYIGFYSRPADPVGLAYWMTQDETAALAGFSKSAEFTNQYKDLSATLQVTKVYMNLLGREPDVGGLTYWAGQLTAGTKNIGELVTQMILDAGGKDIQTIADRVAYSTKFTTSLDTVAEINGYGTVAAFDAARAALLKVVVPTPTTVDGKPVYDHTTLTTALTTVDAIITTIANAGDTTAPVVTAATVSYAENQVAGAVVATVVATDNKAVTGFEITTGNTDGFYAIDATGKITLTTAGLASAANNYESGTNTVTLGVVAKDAGSNTSAVANVVLNETNVGEFSTVNGTSTSVKLTFDADLKATTDVATTAFKVVDSTSANILITSVTVSGKQVTLTLAAAATGTTTVSYTAPTTGGLQDASGNVIASLSGKTYTADATVPTLSSSNAGTVAATADLTLVFSEAVLVGTGNIVLTNAANSADTRTIDVTSSQVTLSADGKTLTINPTADLTAGATYSVAIPVTAVKDLAGNAYAGGTLSYSVVAVVTPGQTFALTSSLDNVVGTSGDDIILGDGAGATPTVSAADQINGGAGTDTLKMYGTVIKPQVSNVENIYLNAPAGDFDASAITGVTSLEIEAEALAAARAYTVTTGQAVKLTNITSATSELDISGNTPTSLNVTMNKVGTISPAVKPIVDFNGTALTAVAITTATASSNIELKNTGTKLTTLTVTGDQQITIDAETSSVNLTSVTASGNTGGTRIQFDSTTNSVVTFVGGTGADRVDFLTTLTAADAADGGTGTDTLRISDADTLTALTAANVKAFEILEATGADATAYDVDTIIANNALTSVGTNVTLGAVTINNINAAATGSIFVTGDAPTTVTLTAKDFVSGGTSDTATIKFDNSVSKHADGVDLTTSLTFANVDVLNINSVSDGTAAVAEVNSVAAITAADLEKIVITGDNAFTVTALAAATVGLTEVDASGMVVNTTSGGLTITTDAAAIATILIKGTSTADTITAANAATNGVTIYTGGGSDTVVLGATAAAHTAVWTATAFNAGDLKAGDVVTFNTGAALATGDTLTLNFSASLEALMKVGGVVLGSTTANVNVFDGVTATALSASTNVAASQAAGALTLDIDMNGDGQYSVSNDVRITILGTGVNDTLVYNAANDNFVFTVVA